MPWVRAQAGFQTAQPRLVCVKRTCHGSFRATLNRSPFCKRGTSREGIVPGAGRAGVQSLGCRAPKPRSFYGPVPTQLLVPAEGEVAGRLVVKLVWGQRGLEGSSTTQESAATSQLSMLSPLGSTQSSKVLLVHVPVWVGRPREHTPGPAVQQGKPPGPPAPAQVPGGGRCSPGTFP